VAITTATFGALTVLADIRWRFLRLQWQVIAKLIPCIQRNAKALIAPVLLYAGKQGYCIDQRPGNTVAEEDTKRYFNKTPSSIKRM